MLNIASLEGCAIAFRLANQQHIGFTLKSVSQAYDFRQLFSLSITDLQAKSIG